ncbi:MAG: hypothetical protein ACON4U_20035 [Myxococcota bacterium]
MQILFQVLIALARPCPKVEITTEASVQDDALDEISGIASYDGKLYVHNDSGDKANIYVMDFSGQLQDTLSLNGVRARDWEDMSISLWNNQTTIFVGDIGDNLEHHKAVFVHAVRINAESPVEAKTWKVSYGDHGPQDAEGLAIDPVDGRLYVLSKGRTGTVNLFRTDPLSQETDQLMLALVAQFPISDRRKPLPAFLTTALDISPNGSQIIMRNYHKAFLWSRETGQEWADVLATPPCQIRMPRQPQGESLAFQSENELVTVSERRHQPLYHIHLLRH